MENFSSLFQQRRFVECENACRSLLLANPGHIQARHTLILAMQSQNKFAAAIAECENLLGQVSKKEDRITVLEHQGELASRIKDYETAIKSYSRSVELDKKRHRTWIALGACYYELNNYPACTEALLKGLKDPSLDDAVYCEAIYFLTESNKSYSYKDLSKLSPRIERPIPNAQYYFTIGSLLEREGNFEKALASYDEANRLLRLRKPYDPDQEIRTVRNYIKSFDKTTLADAAINHEDVKPTPIFIVGMPRTGSSLIEQMLGRHTQISPQGEAKWLPQSFVNHLGNVSSETEFQHRCLSEDLIRAVRKQYFEELGKIETPFFTDKLPGNFSFLFLIRLAFPEAVVIKTNRERLANIWSCYKTPLWHGHSYSHSLTETAAYFDLVESAARQWRDLFEERFIEVSYERFVSDSSRGIKDLLSQLGLEFEEACVHSNSAARIVHTASKNQVTQPVYQDANDSSQAFEPLIRHRIPEPVLD